jgi:hypothetical protein
LVGESLERMSENASKEEMIRSDMAGMVIGGK